MIKTVFHIPPAFSGNQAKHVLVSPSEEGVSFLYFQQHPFFVAGLSVYQYSNVPGQLERAGLLAEACKQEPGKNETWENIYILGNGKPALLVPNAYYSPGENENSLDLVFGESLETVCFADDLPQLQAKNIWRMQQDEYHYLQTHYPGARYLHANTMALAGACESGDALHCIVERNQLKVILFSGGTLQIIQQFTYHTPVDAVYYLLNTCKQYEMSPHSIPLILYGYIETDSTLYQDMYKYFLTINFAEMPRDVNVSEPISQYPGHYFVHLIQLASCAL
ncbi:MAG: hypothetical protein ABS68_03935 [Niastella sp. SCN 39-18]|nr:DUF3822 family protein [Sphingobacteriales bacterium]ODT53791.1 MAG: hypothetical protein ABS68_03935 [Niastella sp. SCN 39-18]